MPAWRASAAFSSETMLWTRVLIASPSGSASTVSRTTVPGSSRAREAVEQLREQHRLELAGRVREGGEGIRIAGLALALAGMQHRAGERADHAAGARLGGELDPGLGAERFEHLFVIVERVAGEEEADRLELARKLIGRAPRLRFWKALHLPRGGSSDRFGRRHGRQEQSPLTSLVVSVSLLGERQYALDIGEGGRPIDTELFEGARRCQGLERSLVEE